MRLAHSLNASVIVRTLVTLLCVLLLGIAPSLAQGTDDAPAPEPTTPLTRVITVVSGEAETPFAGARVEAWEAGRMRPEVRQTDENGIARFVDLPRTGIVYAPSAA